MALQNGLVLTAALAVMLSACSGGLDAPALEAEKVAAIPAELAPFGNGYPNPGDPCMRLGESPATSNYLDDSALLAGCPTQASAETLGGEIVGTMDGVRIVSVPMGDANAGMPQLQSPVQTVDAVVAGTDYNATAIVACGFDGDPPTGECSAGVKRNWAEDGTTLIEVTRPDNTKRAIFFRGTTPYSANSAQADGSAAWDFETSRSGDRVTIQYGPETYVIVDAFVEGG